MGYFLYLFKKRRKCIFCCYFTFLCCVSPICLVFYLKVLGRGHTCFSFRSSFRVNRWDNADLRCTTLIIQQILFCSRRLFYLFITKLEFHGFCVVLSSPRTNASRKLANTLRLPQILLSYVRVVYLCYEGFHESLGCCKKYEISKSYAPKAFFGSFYYKNTLWIFTDF